MAFSLVWISRRHDLAVDGGDVVSLHYVTSGATAENRGRGSVQRCGALNVRFGLQIQPVDGQKYSAWKGIVQLQAGSSPDQYRSNHDC